MGWVRRLTVAVSIVMVVALSFAYVEFKASQPLLEGGGQYLPA